MNYQASNPESLSETQKGLDKKWFTSSSSKETSSRSANFLHKLEQLDCLQDCGETVQFARASPGSDVIPRGGDRFTHYQTLYQLLPELRSRVKGTMDTRGVARIFLKGVLSLVSLARPFLQLVRCIVLTSLATLSTFSLET